MRRPVVYSNRQMSNDSFGGLLELLMTFTLMVFVRIYRGRGSGADCTVTPKYTKSRTGEDKRLWRRL